MGCWPGEAADPELVRLADHVEDAEEQLRGVLARTRPPALRDGDLGSAVASLRDDVRARYALEVAVALAGRAGRRCRWSRP